METNSYTADFWLEDIITEKKQRQGWRTDNLYSDFNS